MEMIWLLVALINLVTAGFNLAVSVLKSRNRKKPYPGSADKASQKHRRE